MMDLDAANRMRDRRLRRRMLSTLHLSRAMSPKGGLGGRALKDLVDGVVPAGQGFESDRHALELARDLVNKGLAEESRLPMRRGQAFGLDFAFFKVTDKGSQLVNESIDPDPDIDDERIVDEG
jgi:hypothetical protein